jgi:hypothetical protein
MNTRVTALLGASLGLIVCSTILTFLRLYGIIEWRIGEAIDLTRVLWPSSVMLTVTWCSTLPGILITISSVAINCLLYAGIAVGIRTALQFAIRPKK